MTEFAARPSDVLAWDRAFFARQLDELSRMLERDPLAAVVKDMHRRYQVRLADLEQRLAALIQEGS